MKIVIAGTGKVGFTVARRLCREGHDITLIDEKPVISDELLKLAKENKPLSTLPLLFTEYKSDELVGIYKGKGTSTERQTVAEILSNINPSKNSEWNQFK